MRIVWCGFAYLKRYLSASGAIGAARDELLRFGANGAVVHRAIYVVVQLGGAANGQKRQANGQALRMRSFLIGHTDGRHKLQLRDVNPEVLIAAMTRASLVRKE